MPFFSGNYLNMGAGVMEKPIIQSDHEKYTMHRYRVLSSTNTFLKEHLEEFTEFSVIWAEEQTAGRGRFTRIWTSAAGKDLTFSMLLPLNNMEKDRWPNIPQVAALAVAEIIERHGLAAKIKWPNDVLVNQKKICGILCESVKRKGKYNAVLGIGVNVNSSQEALADIPVPATSLSQELNTIVPLEPLCLNFIDVTVQYFLELSQIGFIQFRERILERLAYRNEKKEFVDGNKKYTGFIRDINPDGTLQFELADGSIMTLCAGEISFSGNRVES